MLTSESAARATGHTRVWRTACCSGGNPDPVASPHLLTSLRLIIQKAAARVPLAQCTNAVWFLWSVTAFRKLLIRSGSGDAALKGRWTKLLSVVLPAGLAIDVGARFAPPRVRL